jgi:iron complex outermembrane recepter protein
MVAATSALRGGPDGVNGVLVKPTYSSYAPQGRFEYTSLLGDVDNVFTFNPGNTLKNGFATAVDGFNRDPFRRISVPTDRTLIASTMNFDVADHHQLYAEITYGFNHTQSDIEPFALAGTGVAGSVYGGGPGTAADNQLIQQHGC